VLRDFKAFVTRESLIDLAIAVVIAIAFGTLIRSLVVNVFLPVFAIPGSVDFGDLKVTVGGGTIRYGEFLNDLVSFLFVAAAVFFGVVRPLGALNRRGAAPAVQTAPCPRCLSTVPAAATKCPFCTADIGS
jgi:large conductance mechanosensitive channel